MVQKANVGEHIGLILLGIGVVGFIVCLSIGIVILDVHIIIRLGVLYIFLAVVGLVTFVASQK